MITIGLDDPMSVDAAQSDPEDSTIVRYFRSTTRPIEYWLTVYPNVESQTFKGEVTIEILAVQTTDTIVLHAENLNVNEVVVTSCEKIDGKVQKISSTFEPRDTTEYLTVKTEQPLLVEGRYKVKITFVRRSQDDSAQIGPNLVNNKRKKSKVPKMAYIAEAVFDPHFARRGFPCYDEPHYRTPFTITVARNAYEKIISNTPLTYNNTITFRKTDPIPTHMVYYAILGSMYHQYGTNKNYRIWTMEKFKDETQFAARNLEKIAESMKRTFSSVKYDVKRIDLVIPIHGENPASYLPYVKRNLLCDVQNCPVKHQHQVTKSVTYHVSNKWFGNYVSIYSWDYLWLRDGISTYYGYEYGAKLQPEWRLSDYLGSVVSQRVLFDDHGSFGPLVFESSKDEVFRRIYSEKYSTFYNDKASLIIRMLKNIAGDLVFKRIMIEFLKNGHENEGLVRLDHLSAAFESAQVELEDEIRRKKWYGRHSRSFINSFTWHAGYPLLTATYDSDDATIMIEATQLFSDETIEWVVPITFTTQTKANFENLKPVNWISGINTVTKIKRTIIDENEWYILNLKNAAFCRVNYEYENWTRLVDQLKESPQVIHHLNRAQLITDSYALAAAYKLDLSIPITMTTYLPKEEDPFVWMVALNQFKYFYSALGKKLRPVFKTFFLGCLKHEYERIGFEINQDDSPPTKMWKNELVNFLCWIGDEDCINAAKKLYEDNENNLTRIDPDLRHVVFCTMLRGADSHNVKMTLNKLIEKNDNTCLRETVRKASNCQLSPWKSKTNPADAKMYENLFTRILNEDETVGKHIHEILKLWDTLLPLLEMMERITKAWLRVYMRNADDRTQISENKVKGLTSFIQFFEHKVSGVAEEKMVHLIKANVNSLLERNNEKFKSLAEAVEKLSNTVESRREYVDEDSLVYLLQTNTCDATSLPELRAPMSPSSINNDDSSESLSTDFSDLMYTDSEASSDTTSTDE